MIKLYILIFISFMVTACGTNVPKAPVKVVTSASLFSYEPQDREQFVFDEVADILQKYAYKDLCFKRPSKSVVLECISNKLPYNKYVGKKGYYTSSEPFLDSSGYIAREAIIETGEVIYLVTSSEYEHIGEYIISLEEYEKIKNYRKEKITEGSEVYLTGYSKLRRGRFNVSSQNDHSFTTKEVQAIRTIASNYPDNGAKIADLLTTLIINYDDFEKRSVITSAPYNNPSSYLSIKFIFKDNGEFYPYLVTRYNADNWLFVESFSISADGFRWDSPKLKFNRDHSNGKIWEWNTQAITAETIAMLEHMANSKDAIIRFQGRQYYDDYQLTDKQKLDLSRLIKIFNLTQAKL